ncbi:hypothetical protein WMY93_008242 [Mugilogobius chulae]|uniref:Uncharacterized protein n=1 Tax=Mugilogobius chulae TaxID=88201 RepID=A0AAW0PKD9_9GOBI
MGNVESQNATCRYQTIETFLLCQTRTQKLRGSTRSSSTPSIPQSLAENGIDPFDAPDGFEDFGINPPWTQRMAMTLRPESFQHDDDNLATPTPDTSEADTVAPDGGDDSMGKGRMLEMRGTC